MNSRPHISSEVTIPPINPDRFKTVLDQQDWTVFEQAIEQARRLLKGRILWNINSTAAGGGVAEMLRSLMAYVRGADIDARWVAVSGPPEFFRVTKRLHNLLHGDAGDGGLLGDDEREVYEQTGQHNAEEVARFVEPRDIVILHDPQTAPMARKLKDTGALVVWRSHIGTEHPTQPVFDAWNFLLSYVFAADARVFSRYLYVPPELRGGHTTVVTPSIDPFSVKNQDMEPSAIRAILSHVGIIAAPAPAGAEPVFYPHQGPARRVERRCSIISEGVPASFDIPLVVQVSRWDRLKDPHGVMMGFVDHAAQGTDAHLILAGPSVEGVADDPEGAETLAEITEAWTQLPPDKRARVHLVSIPMNDLEENAAIVNALQRHAAIIVQKSLREGFGLTVTEAMWKQRPIVASDLGGIRKQIDHRETGILLANPRDLDSFGQTLRELLQNHEFSTRLGTQARRHVLKTSLHNQHFLTWLRVLGKLQAALTGA